MGFTHRTGILILLSVLALLLIFSAIDARYYAYVYSFESGYEVLEETETPCHVQRNAQWISCGRLATAEHFLARFSAARGAEARRTILGLLDRGYSELQVVEYLIEEFDVSYKREQRFDRGTFVKTSSISMLAAVVWFLVLYHLHNASN